MDFPVRMRRSEASQYLYEAHGVRVAAVTLAKYATVGGGPKFEKLGRWPLYRRESLDAWVREKLSPEVSSTAELQADKAA